MDQGAAERVAGVRLGEILAGKYRVDWVLGTGGMGAVVAAHHLQLDARVAIKLLLPSMLPNPEVVARFAREARAASRMTNDHVARVLDVGTLDTGAPYIVMEFLAGNDLGTLLKQRGPLPFEEAIDFVLQTCEAIAEAHALGIIHRDLKPTNLFCIRATDGRLAIKVLDFGISKVISPMSSFASMPLTQAATLLGTPFYMSPEQMHAPHTVDFRTDIWAIGVILYESLTGEVPFFGDSLPEVSVKIATRPPRPLRDLRPDTPGGLEAVILRCLEKERDRRFGNVAELARSLLPFAAKRAKVSVERITDIIQTAGLSATGPSMPEPSCKPSALETIAPLGKSAAQRAGVRRPVLVLLAGALTLVVLLAIAFGSSNRIRSRPGTLHPAAVPPDDTIALGPAVLPSNEPSTASTPHASASAVSGTVTIGSELASLPHEPSRVTIHRRPAALPAAPAAMAPSPVPSPPATAVAGARPDCDTNFFFDDQGRKHFKPECWITPPAAQAAASSATTDCDPNYYLDEQGRKHFKPECFLKR